MRSGVALWVCLSVASGTAMGEDPHCWSSPKCVGRIEYDARLTDFHKRVLESMHISYEVEDQKGRIAIWWVSRSEAEKKEVDGRVSQYSFAIHACPRDKWPTPETPAGTLTYCTEPKP
jgi:hypothetical protein